MWQQNLEPVKMLITIVTIFPEFFPGVLKFGISGRGFRKLWDLSVVNIRDFAKDKHKTVDDTPYGGGAGMVMKPDVVNDALKKALSFYNEKPKIIFMTPRGKVFSQKIAQEIMQNKPEGMIILCGRYEGIDQRVIDFWKSEHGMVEISIGDYILSGGEIPAMVLIDSCLRLLPGIMHNDESIKQESFSLDLLEYPQYTKPAVWEGKNVPSVLLSGNHKEIAVWRMEKAKQITKDIRPDLWTKFDSVDS